MNDKTVRRLLNLNRAFYRDFAMDFAETRARPMLGFEKVLDFLPRPCHRLLDVGCGEGRFGRFLIDQQAIGEYTGIDFSSELLGRAKLAVNGTFVEKDLSVPGFLDGLGSFQAVACLAVLQHIPGRENRSRMLSEIAGRLASGGCLILSNWQFPDSERQRRKIITWSSVNLMDDDVEPGDYLLTWQRGGHGLRYVCHIDLAETERLAREAGLFITAHFRSDGREGNLNLYVILEVDRP